MADEPKHAPPAKPQPPSDALGYWNSIQGRLLAEVQRRVIPEIDQSVLFSIAFFSCVQETFLDRATQHREWVGNLRPALVHIQDVLRGILAGYREQCPATLAAMHRIALEVRCTVAFILRHTEPAKQADLWWRYMDVQRYLYDLHRAPEDRLVSPAEKTRIETSCTEWFKDGKVRVKYWTADPGISTFRVVAEKVGMLSDYRTMYALTSTFVHGAALLRNAYRAGCAGVPADNARQALMACGHAIRMLLEMADFFGVPYEQDDHLGWLLRTNAALEKVNSVQIPR
jgi:hypothetical protein